MSKTTTGVVVLLSFCAAIVAGCCCLCSGEKVKLAENGQAKAVIVIAKEATKAAQFGAIDLKWHLDKITGANFEIVTDDKVSQPLNPSTPQLLINVGFTKFTKAKPSDFKGQEFLVDIRRDGMDLVGTDEADTSKVSFALDDSGFPVGGQGNWPSAFRRQSTMYAVYEFLENVCGARWIDSSDFGTVLPQDASLSVPLMTKKSDPFLAYRGGTFERAAGYNAHIHNRAACEELEYRHLKGAKNRDALIRSQKGLFMMRHRFGGDYGQANHSFYGWYDRFWKKNEKAPQSWKGERKDFFAQGYEGLPPQLCYSNPEVIEQVARDADTYFTNGGWLVRNQQGKVVHTNATWGVDNFCLEPMDNTSMCKCPRCSAQYEPGRATTSSEHSTYWFRFVKAVAEKIAAKWPEKRVTTLAYASHEGLPKDVVLPKNVVVYFCLSGNRTMFGVPVEEHAQFKRMAEWRAAYPDQPLAFWLYNCFPAESYESMGFKGVPGFFSRDAEAQYRYFAKLNARAGVYQCGLNGEVDNYLQLEWMFDAGRSADAMLTDYFAAYGKPGPYLRKFYELVERRYCGRGNHRVGQELGLESCWKYIIRDEDWAELTALMEKALAVAETPAERHFADVWKLAVYDYMKEGHDTYAERAASPQPSWTAPRIAACGGDLAKVPWDGLKLIETPLYWRGGKQAVSESRAALRLAHDGEHLYVELTEFLDTAKLYNSSMIVCYDEIEVMFACQKASPYRVWFNGPNGNVSAASFHEVNWRWNVTSKEHGLPLFGAKYASDVTKPDRWTLRWAFPLKTMLNREIRPGDEIYMNATTVLGPHYKKDFPSSNKLILTLTSFTSVHSPDRAVTIALEK